MTIITDMMVIWCNEFTYAKTYESLIGSSTLNSDGGATTLQCGIGKLMDGIQTKTSTYHSKKWPSGTTGFKYLGEEFNTYSCDSDSVIFMGYDINESYARLCSGGVVDCTRPDGCDPNWDTDYCWEQAPIDVVDKSFITDIRIKCTEQFSKSGNDQPTSSFPTPTVLPPKDDVITCQQDSNSYYTTFTDQTLKIKRSESGWKHRLVGSSTWNSMTTDLSSSKYKFANSIIVKKGTEYGRDQIFSVGLSFGDIIKCEDHLVPKVPPNLAYNVNVGTHVSPSVDISSGTTSISHDILSNPATSMYFTQTEKVHCPLFQCSVLEDCDSSKNITLTQPDLRIDTSSNDFIVNTDPLQEIQQKVCIQCQNKRSGHSFYNHLGTTQNTAPFDVSVTCSTNVTIFEPILVEDSAVPDLYKVQVCQATDDASNKCGFQFESFRTQSQACQVLQYRILNSQTVQTSVTGLDYSNPILDGEGLTANSGWVVTPKVNTTHIQSNVFRVNALDYKRPFQFKFVIEATIRGGNVFYSQQMNLTVTCPPTVVLKENANLATGKFSSYLGADTAGNCENVFKFGDFTPELPLCHVITSYEIVNQNPSGFLTYPSTSPCYAFSTDSILIDVNTVQVISFKIKVNIESYPSQTHPQRPDISEYTINITSTQQTPKITMSSLPNDLAIPIDSAYAYQISMSQIQCSTSCLLSGYDVSNQNTSPTMGLSTQVSGLGPKAVYQYPYYSISVDTSSVTTYQFFVYVQVASISTIYQFSNQVTLKVVCGSENIHVRSLTKKLAISPYDRVSGGSQTYSFIQVNQALTIFDPINQSSIGMFYSSNIQCPITQFEAYTDSGLSNAWNDPSIQLLDKTNTASTSLLIDTSNAMSISLFVKASSGVNPNQQNYLELSIIVCGNERVLSSSTTYPRVVGQIGDTMKISYTSYQNFFSITQADDPYCELFDFGIKTGALCDQPPLMFQFDTTQPINQQDIIISTANSVSEAELCIEITTKGKSTGFKKILVEICGNEQISLQTQGQPPSIQVYSYRDPFTTVKEAINVSKQGYYFESSSSGCGISSYSLQTQDEKTLTYKDYTGDAVSLDASDTVDIKIFYSVQNPLMQNLFLRASQQSGKHSFLPIQIKVCGFESLTVLEPEQKNYTYSTNQQMKEIEQGTFQNYFSTNDSNECPIGWYRLLHQNKSQEYVNTDFLMLEFVNGKYQITIHPSKVPDNTQELIEFVYLQAITKGGQTADILYQFKFVPKGDLVNFAPYFCNAQPPLFFEISAMYGKEKIELPGRAALPEICDDDNDTIKIIDPSKGEYMFSKTKGGELTKTLKIPDFVKFGLQRRDPRDWHYQLLEIDTDEGENIYIREAGYYETKQYLEDTWGNMQEVQINFFLTLSDLSGQKVNSVDQLAQTDLKFIIDITRQPFNKISSMRFFYTGDDTSQRDLMDHILFDVIVCEQPKSEEDWQADYDTGYSLPYMQIKCVASGKHLVHNYESYMEKFGKQLPFDEMKEIFQTKGALELCGLNQNDKEVCHAYDFQQSDLYKSKDSKGKQFSDHVLSNLLEYADQVFKGVIQKAVTIEVDNNYEQPKYPSITSVNLVYGQKVHLLLIITFSEPMDKLSEDQIKNSTFLEIYAHSVADFSMVRGIDLDKLPMLNDTKIPSVKEEQSLADRDLKFNWKLFHQSNYQYKVSIQFDDPVRVSASHYGKDKMSIKILNDSVFGSVFKFQNGTETNIIGLNETFVDKHILSKNLLRPMLPDLEMEQELIETIDSISLLILVLQANMLILNILLSKSLQDLWGMLNTQQITIHLMLFKCQETLPGNVFVFNSYLSQLNQKDMYPTDIMFEEIFNFTETESPNEHFETLGYEGHNFIDMTGSVLINITLAICLNAVCQLINQIALRCRRFSCARKIGSSLRLQNTVGAIFIIYLQAYLEISLCCIIAVSGMEKEHIDGSNKSDMISSIFAIISGVILFSLPFVIMRFTKRNASRLDDPKMRDEVGYLYTGLAVQSRFQSSFHAVYMIRRMMFVAIIFFFYQNSSLQLVYNLVLTIVYIVYIQTFQPFEEKQQNKWEIFNEVNVVTASYSLMWLIQSTDLDERFKYGWGYIVVCSISLLINALKVAFNLFIRSLPESYRNLKRLYDERQYLKMTEKWMQEKISYGESLGDHKIGKVIVEVMELTRRIRQNKKDILSLNQRVLHQMDWLQKNGYEYKDVLQEDISESAALLATLKDDKTKVEQLNQKQRFIHDQMVERNKKNQRFFTYEKLDYQSYINQILQEAEQRRADRAKRHQVSLALQQAITHKFVHDKKKKAQDRKEKEDKAQKSKSELKQKSNSEPRSKSEKDKKGTQKKNEASQGKAKKRRNQMLIEDGPVDFDTLARKRDKSNDRIREFLKKEAMKKNRPEEKRKDSYKNKSIESATARQQEKQQRKKGRRENSKTKDKITSQLRRN